MPDKTLNPVDMLVSNSVPSEPLLGLTPPDASTDAPSGDSISTAHSNANNHASSATSFQAVTGAQLSESTSRTRRSSTASWVMTGTKRGHHRLEEGEYFESADGEVLRDQPRPRKRQAGISKLQDTESHASLHDYRPAAGNQGTPSLLQADETPSSGSSHTSYSPASSTQHTLPAQEEPDQADDNKSCSLTSSTSIHSALGCDACASLRARYEALHAQNEALHAQNDLLQDQHRVQYKTWLNENKSLREKLRLQKSANIVTGSDAGSATPSPTSGAFPPDVNSPSTPQRVRNASKRGEPSRVNSCNGKRIHSSSGTSALADGIERVAVQSAAANSAALLDNPIGLACRPFRPSNFNLGEVWRITFCAVALDTRAANDPQTNKKCLQAEEGRISVCNRPAAIVDISEDGLGVLFSESAGGDGPDFRFNVRENVFLLVPKDHIDGKKAKYLKVIPDDGQHEIKKGSYLNISKDYPVNYKQKMTKYGALSREDTNKLLDAWHRFKAPPGLYQENARFRDEIDSLRDETDRLARKAEKLGNLLDCANDQLHFQAQQHNGPRPQSRQHNVSRSEPQQTEGYRSQAQQSHGGPTDPWSRNPRRQ